MKKLSYFIISIVCAFFLPSCEKTDYPHNSWPFENRSSIRGKLSYMANPFFPEDTILCLMTDNVHIKVYNEAYCEYVRELFAHYGGKLSECKYHHNGPHEWVYSPSPVLCTIPTRDGKFISLMDNNTNQLADSICLMMTDIYLKGDYVRHIYTTIRKDSLPDNEEEWLPDYYMDDWVEFNGSDDMTPIFILDTISPDGNQIVCFDSQFGPNFAAL